MLTWTLELLLDVDLVFSLYFDDEVHSFPQGYDVLKRISNVISRADRRQLEQLTG
jgi:hypothetical protein